MARKREGITLPGRHGRDVYVDIPWGWTRKYTGTLWRGDRFWNPGMEIWVRASDHRTCLYEEAEKFHCVIEKCDFDPA